MAQNSALTTEKAPQNASNVKGCPRLQSFIDLGHFLTLWLVPIWEVLGMWQKSIEIYLRRVPNYFFHLESLIFHREVGVSRKITHSLL
jgi:hypothetical protein